MLKKIFVSFFCCLAVFFANNVNAGYIFGNVGIGKDPIAEGTVIIMDSVNAEIIQEVNLINQGYYESETLPDGVYRVYVESREIINGFISEGEPHYDFCSAQEYTVTGNNAVEVSASFRASVPTVILLLDGTISGRIIDSITEKGLANIKVMFLDVRTGLSRDQPTYTDSNGYFSWIFKRLPYSPELKVRFVDEEGVYLPKFAGGGDSDDFCMGAIYNIEKDPKILETMKTPADAIEDLIAAVNNIVMPVNAANSLIAKLEKAENFLIDKNPNNDNAACGQLKGFLGQLNGMVNSDKITQAEADVLLKAVAALQDSLGCS